MVASHHLDARLGAPKRTPMRSRHLRVEPQAALHRKTDGLWVAAGTRKHGSQHRVGSSRAWIASNIDGTDPSAPGTPRYHQLGPPPARATSRTTRPERAPARTTFGHRCLDPSFPSRWRRERTLQPEPKRDADPLLAQGVERHEALASAHPCPEVALDPQGGFRVLSQSILIACRPEGELGRGAPHALRIRAAGGTWNLHACRNCGLLLQEHLSAAALTRLARRNWFQASDPIAQIGDFHAAIARSMAKPTTNTSTVPESAGAPTDVLSTQLRTQRYWLQVYVAAFAARPEHAVAHRVLLKPMQPA